MVTRVAVAGCHALTLVALVPEPHPGERGHSTLTQAPAPHSALLSTPLPTCCCSFRGHVVCWVAELAFRLPPRARPPCSSWCSLLDSSRSSLSSSPRSFCVCVWVSCCLGFRSPAFTTATCSPVSSQCISECVRRRNFGSSAVAPLPPTPSPHSTPPLRTRGYPPLQMTPALSRVEEQSAHTLGPLYRTAKAQ